MPASIYQVDPIRDLPYAEEFFANPVGHQSPGLRRGAACVSGGTAAGQIRAGDRNTACTVAAGPGSAGSAASP